MKLSFLAEMAPFTTSSGIQFPFVACGPGESLPACESKPDASGMAGHMEADPSDWLARSPPCELLMQRVFQENGYSMTLLMPENEDTSEEGES